MLRKRAKELIVLLKPMKLDWIAFPGNQPEPEASARPLPQPRPEETAEAKSEEPENDGQVFHYVFIRFPKCYRVFFFMAPIPDLDPSRSRCLWPSLASSAGPCDAVRRSTSSAPNTIRRWSLGKKKTKETLMPSTLTASRAQSHARRWFLTLKYLLRDLAIQRNTIKINEKKTK